MEKKEVIELVKYRNKMLSELKEEMKALESSENGLLHSPGREVHVKRMQDLRQELRNIELYFRSIGTFDTKEFTKFMTKFFTLTNGEIYTRTIRKPQNPKGPLGGDSYYIVHSKDHQELVDGLTDTDENLRHFIKVLDLPYVTTIRGEKTYPFKSNATMKGEFGKHHRLKYAIYELMQLRVDHPELSDQEHYNTVLENTRRRNETVYSGGQK
jgi:hypothetical protein